MIARIANHAGAHHYYIHLIEASPTPERAEASADRLGALMPAAGHMVHMPAHIYLRVGRYADAAEANVRAIAADEDYLAQCQAQGLYPRQLLPAQPAFPVGRGDARRAERRGDRRRPPGGREGAAPPRRRGGLDRRLPGDAVARLRALRSMAADAHRARAAGARALRHRHLALRPGAGVRGARRDCRAPRPSSRR